MLKPILASLGQSANLKKSRGPHQFIAETGLRTQVPANRKTMGSKQIKQKSDLSPRSQLEVPGFFHDGAQPAYRSRQRSPGPASSAALPAMFLLVSLHRWPLRPSIPECPHGMQNPPLQGQSLGCQQTQVLISALSLLGYVTWGEITCLSEPQCLQLSEKDPLDRVVWIK